MAEILPSSSDAKETEKKYNANGFLKGIKGQDSVGDEEFLPACEQFESLNETNSQMYTGPDPGACQAQDDAIPPYQTTNLFSYDDTEYYSNYHFGLIRGYHREMYEDKPSEQRRFLCCSSSLDRETVNRIKRRNRILSWQVTGILFGAVFIFFGVTSLVISFIVSSDETKDFFWRSLDVPTMYIHLIAIVGLTILTLGSALVSLCLLVPLCIGRLNGQDMQGFWCTTGDLYIKNAEKTYNFAPNQFLYFDAAVYGNFVGNADVKKVQPQIINE